MEGHADLCAPWVRIRSTQCGCTSSNGRKVSRLGATRAGASGLGDEREPASLDTSQFAAAGWLSRRVQGRCVQVGEVAWTTTDSPHSSNLPRLPRGLPPMWPLAVFSSRPAPPTPARPLWLTVPLTEGGPVRPRRALGEPRPFSFAGPVSEAGPDPPPTPFPPAPSSLGGKPPCACNFRRHR